MTSEPPEVDGKNENGAAILRLCLNLGDGDAGLLRIGNLLRLRRCRQNDGWDTRGHGTSFFADGACVKISGRVRQKCGDFLLAGFVEHERSACVGQSSAVLASDFDPQDKAIGIGADEQIAFRIKRQRASVPFVTLIKKFTFAVRSHDENLPRIAGRDKQRAIRIDRQRPNIFCLGFEEDALLAVGRYFVHFSVGRGADEKIVVRIENDRLRGKLG